jgi:integrase
MASAGRANRAMVEGVVKKNVIRAQASVAHFVLVKWLDVAWSTRRFTRTRLDSSRLTHGPEEIPTPQLSLVVLRRAARRHEALPLEDEKPREPYVQFGFWTGVRTSELFALRWSDVDWRHGSVRVPERPGFEPASPQGWMRLPEFR